MEHMNADAVEKRTREINGTWLIKMQHRSDVSVNKKHPLNPLMNLIPFYFSRPDYFVVIHFLTLLWRNATGMLEGDTAFQYKNSDDDDEKKM